MKINELKIYCSNLSKQTKFYTQIIGLELVKKTDIDAIFQIGNSRLRFVEDENFLPYHYAINIPCNQENEALKWLKKRVDILKNGNIEIQDFDFWNAKAIYFYDTDKNIVELIARKNLKNESDKVFNENSLLEISEIGIPVNDIKSTYGHLAEVVEMKIFDGGFDRFCAIGDENGLFICINKQLKDWFPTSDKAYSSEFTIDFIEKGKDYKLEFKNGKLKAVADTV
ncbi:MAG: VOC family protein [Bacteroidales bacterium]|nr:VOC family protein [Bacteroidales bacterium]